MVINAPCPTRQAPYPSAPTTTATGASEIDPDPAHIGHLVVIGHPSTASFNHAIASTYAAAVHEAGQSVVVRDLYATRFDPLLKTFEQPEAPGFTLSDDVKQELVLVRHAASITLVFPIWFGMPPAIVTGYIDRVLGAGLTGSAIRHNEPHSLLKGKRLVLLTTSGATKPWLAEHGHWLGLRSDFDDYLEVIFSLAGCEHEHFDSVVSPLAPTYAAECLGRAKERARSTCSALLDAVHRRQREARSLSRSAPR